MHQSIHSTSVFFFCFSLWPSAGEGYEETRWPWAIRHLCLMKEGPCYVCVCVCHCLLAENVLSTSPSRTWLSLYCEGATSSWEYFPLGAKIMRLPQFISMRLLQKKRKEKKGGKKCRLIAHMSSHKSTSWSNKACTHKHTGYRKSFVGSCKYTHTHTIVFCSMFHIKMLVKLTVRSNFWARIGSLSYNQAAVILANNTHELAVACLGPALTPYCCGILHHSPCLTVRLELGFM